MLLGYRLAPLEGNESTQESNTQTTETKIAAILQDYGRRLETIEKQLTIQNVPKKGGNSEWPTI